MPERNNRHVGSSTPVPAIPRACSVKHRPGLSRRNQSKTTINYIISGIILPAETELVIMWNYSRLFYISCSRMYPGSKTKDSSIIIFSLRLSVSARELKTIFIPRRRRGCTVSHDGVYVFGHDHIHVQHKFESEIGCATPFIMHKI